MLQRTLSVTLLGLLSVVLIGFEIVTSMSVTGVCVDYVDRPGRCFNTGTDLDWNVGLIAGVALGLVLTFAAVCLWKSRRTPGLVLALVGAAGATGVVLTRLGDL